MLYVFIAIWFIWWIFAFKKPIWIKIAKLPAIAMTIAPFVLHKKKFYAKNERIRNHEMRHIWQQRFLSPLIMLVLYLIFSGILFVFFYFKTFKVDKAFEKCYLYNPFERDARKHE